MERALFCLIFISALAFSNEADSKIIKDLDLYINMDLLEGDVDFRHIEEVVETEMEMELEDLK